MYSSLHSNYYSQLLLLFSITLTLNYYSYSQSITLAITFKTMASKPVTQRVGEIDVSKIVFGQKTNYLNAPGSYVPIKVKNQNGILSELKYQVRGAKIVYAGHKKELKDTEKKDLTTVTFWISVDASETTCDYLPTKKNDVAEFFKYTKALEKQAEEELKAHGVEWGVIKKAGMPFDLFSLVSEGIKKKIKDSTGKEIETNEEYPPSIRIPLSFKNEGGKKIPVFDVTFINAKTQEPITNITPDNIGKIIRRGTYCIAIISDGRLWLGNKQSKITRKCTQLKLLFPEESQSESDDFTGIMVAPHQEVDPNIDGKLKLEMAKGASSTTTSSTTSAITTAEDVDDDINLG